MGPKEHLSSVNCRLGSLTPYSTEEETEGGLLNSPAFQAQPHSYHLNLSGHTRSNAGCHLSLGQRSNVRQKNKVKRCNQRCSKNPLLSSQKTLKVVPQETLLSDRLLTYQERPKAWAWQRLQQSGSGLLGTPQRTAQPLTAELTGPKHQYSQRLSNSMNKVFQRRNQ